MPMYLPRNLVSLIALCDRKSANVRFPGMSTLHVMHLGGGRYRAEATDGKRAAVVQGYPPTVEGPDYPGLAHATDGREKALIPTDQWKRAVAMLKRDPHKDYPPLGVCLGSEDITFASRDQTMFGNTVDWGFPEVDRILPRHPPRFTVAVDPKLLAELLTVAAAFTDDASNKVLLHFYSPTTPFGVSCHNDQRTQFFDGLIMPLTITE